MSNQQLFEWLKESLDKHGDELAKLRTDVVTLSHQVHQLETNVSQAAQAKAAQAGRLWGIGGSVVGAILGVVFDLFHKK